MNTDTLNKATHTLDCISMLIIYPLWESDIIQSNQSLLEEVESLHEVVLRLRQDIQDKSNG